MIILIILIIQEEEDEATEGDAEARPVATLADVISKAITADRGEDNGEVGEGTMERCGGGGREGGREREKLESLINIFNIVCLC